MLHVYNWWELKDCFPPYHSWCGSYNRSPFSASPGLFRRSCELQAYDLQKYSLIGRAYVVPQVNEAVIKIGNNAKSGMIKLQTTEAELNTVTNIIIPGSIICNYYRLLNYWNCWCWNAWLPFNITLSFVINHT